jgi:maleate cis-trans isomerase
MVVDAESRRSPVTKAREEDLRIGFLYPGYAAEDDYPRLAKSVQPPVRAEVVHTSIGEDAHRVDALRDMGGKPRLLEGANVLADRGVSSVVWSSTSASFVFGWEGAKEQVSTLEDALGVPASTTAFGFVAAATTIGARKVAVIATYPDDIARRFEDFLNTGGIEVLDIRSHGIATAAEVGTLGRDVVLEMAAKNDCADADALLVPDTALHTAAMLEDLESVVEKPVLTANQVTFWEALRLARIFEPQEGLGKLFRNSVADPKSRFA